MCRPQSTITFPVELHRPAAREELVWLLLLGRLLESRLLQVLRFKAGDVYNAQVRSEYRSTQGAVFLWVLGHERLGLCDCFWVDC